LFISEHRWAPLGTADIVALLVSGSTFGGSLATLFSPLGAEYNLATKFPQAEKTVQNITVYQTLMEEMRGAYRA
jgi:amphiphysin